MSDIQDRIAKLERELAELKAQVKPPVKPPEPQKPWPKYDPTEGFRLPASAVKAMVDVVPDFRGIAQEQKHGRSEPGFLKPTEAGPVVRGTGWQNPEPLGNPPGIKYVDQLIDVQDAVDKRELEKRLGGR
jgi:hypothetical protein